MSDTSMGPGWWIASDGKWYPPEQAPQYAPPSLPTAHPQVPHGATATIAAPPQQVTHTFQPPAGYKLKKKRRWPWVLLAIVVLLVVGAAIAGTADEQDAQQSSTANDQAAPAVEADPAATSDAAGSLTVGSTDDTSGFDVTLLQLVDPWTSTNQFESPDAGNRFIAVELNMVNTTDEIRPFSTLLGMEVIDSLGQRWNPAFAGFDLPQLDGDVNPGSNIRGWQVFEVPADSTGLRLKVAGSLTASGIEFQL